MGRALPVNLRVRKTERGLARHNLPSRTQQINGEDMLRFLGAGVFLLAVASSVSAGERYVEIWNPPEARIGAPACKCAPKTHAPTVSSHSAGKVVPRRVADPLAARSATSKRAPVSVVKKPAAPPPLYIPRVITPEGNVLQV
jgi:hypothetical protein